MFETEGWEVHSSQGLKIQERVLEVLGLIPESRLIQVLEFYFIFFFKKIGKNCEDSVLNPLPHPWFSSI